MDKKEETRRKDKMAMLAIYCFFAGAITGGLIERIDAQNKAMQNTTAPIETEYQSSLNKEEMIESLLEIPYSEYENISFDNPEQIKTFLSNYEPKQEIIDSKIIIK